MPLTVREKSWLVDYQKALAKMHPGMVERIALFGSKARGDDHPDSDLDVLVIVKDKGATLKRKLRRIGYLLASGGQAVPSIIVYTEAEWESRKRSRSPFREAVERDEVRVL